MNLKKVKKVIAASGIVISCGLMVYGLFSNIAFFVTGALFAACFFINGFLVDKKKDKEEK